MIKRLFTTLLILMVVTSLAGFFGYKGLVNWGIRKNVVENQIIFELERGQTLSSFSKVLASSKIIDHPIAFQLWVKLFGKYSKFKAGQYRAQREYSIADLVSMIEKGETYYPVVYSLSVPEGFTLKQICARLAGDRIDNYENLWVLSHQSDFLHKLGVTADSLEGYLFPATYSYTEVPSGKKVFQDMSETFWNNLPENYEATALAHGLTLHQAITFASLIELETPYDQERSEVSEVIWNRLKHKIALAIDASIIYGISDYQGDLKTRHLKDPTNPYNTRVHLGLPPGPIGAPSLKSLAAVFNPSHSGYFYYVLDLETVRHKFSKSLSEHNKSVRKFLKDRKVFKKK